MARIMIIDDEETVREALCATVAAAGHEACAAANGARALEKLSAFRPDLVLTWDHAGGFF